MHPQVKLLREYSFSLTPPLFLMKTARLFIFERVRGPNFLLFLHDSNSGRYISVARSYFSKFEGRKKKRSKTNLSRNFSKYIFEICFAQAIKKKKKSLCVSQEVPHFFHLLFRSNALYYIS